MISYLSSLDLEVVRLETGDKLVIFLDQHLDIDGDLGDVDADRQIAYPLWIPAGRRGRRGRLLLGKSKARG